MPDFAMPTNNLAVLDGPYQPDLIRAEVLADIFEATALRVPDKAALTFGTRCLTYRSRPSA